MREVKGIDLYSGQGDVKWSQVAASGDVEFAIVKATEGATLVDSRVARNARSAQEAGLRLAYYHFGRPDLGDADPATDALGEAARFLHTLADLPSPDELRFASGRVAAVFLDLEKPIERWNAADGLRWVEVFLRAVEERYPVGLYTSREWLSREALPDAASFAQLLERRDGSQRPIWIARYGLNDGQVPDRTRFSPDDKVPAGWGQWDIWQYTSKGVIGGINRPCDVNLARM